MWVRLSCTLQICPSHCRCLCRNWSSTGSSLALSRITVFQSMSQRMTPRMSLKHYIWNVFNFWISCCVTAQVSAPYKRTDMTRVQKVHILVVILMFLLQNSFLLHIWHTLPATSSRDFLLHLSSQIGNDCTSSRVWPSRMMGCSESGCCSPERDPDKHVHTQTDLHIQAHTSKDTHILSVATANTLLNGVPRPVAGKAISSICKY